MVFEKFKNVQTNYMVVQPAQNIRTREEQRSSYTTENTITTRGLGVSATVRSCSFRTVLKPIFRTIVKNGVFKPPTCRPYVVTHPIPTLRSFFLLCMQYVDNINLITTMNAKETFQVSSTHSN